MGINNIFKFIRPILLRSRVQTYRGKIFAVDMSCYIHKAIHHYPKHMKHLDVYMNLFRRIADHTFLVFDGKSPKIKAQVLEERLKHKNKYHSTNRTPDIYREIIEKYKMDEKFTLVVAPQESDPQLAYMSLKGKVDYLITEDSDLIVYGCDKIIFKLIPNGSCMVYKKEKFEKYIEKFNWDLPTFKLICILCGCDYFKGGVRGMGFQKATKIVKKPFETDVELKEFVIRNFQMTDDTYEKFKTACLFYTNQLIQANRKIAPFHELMNDD